jgi:hypothetical protein
MGFSWVFSAAIASGAIYNIPGGIEIPPGTGIALIQVNATASNVFEILFSWLEDF